MNNETIIKMLPNGRVTIEFTPSKDCNHPIKIDGDKIEISINSSNGLARYAQGRPISRNHITDDVNSCLIDVSKAPFVCKLDFNNGKERFFALKRPFEHPYVTYEVGTNFTARMWSDKMGHGMEEKEFIKLAETDDRFKQYFKETTS